MWWALHVIHDEHRRHGAGELADGTEDVLCLNATLALKARRLNLGAPAEAELSLQAPGVSRLNGPPGPNLRSAKAWIAAAMSPRCGGQYASKTLRDPC
jgi:hypothetical protein